MVNVKKFITHPRILILIYFLLVSLTIGLLFLGVVYWQSLGAPEVVGSLVNVSELVVDPLESAALIEDLEINLKKIALAEFEIKFYKTLSTIIVVSLLGLLIKSFFISK